jgi:putative aminopeptidase FrvX
MVCLPRPRGRGIVASAMPLDPVLRDLLSAPGPSGYEQAPAAVWRAAAGAFAAEVWADRLGSCLARVPGNAGGLTVAIMGHIDEIGLLVTHVDEGGFVYVRAIGSWDPQVLVSQRVVLLTQAGPLAGVVGKKPIHLSREEPDRGPLELKDLHVDVGARDREEAAALVEVGDVAVIAGEPLLLRNDRLAARGLDNRLGAYVALEAARLVAAAGGAAGDVLAAATAQEEIGHHGARSVAHELAPDVAIVVDVGHETSAPDIDVRKLGAHAFGSGPAISRSSTLHPALFRLLRDAAREAEIPFTVYASGTPTLTDADDVHNVRGGIPTAVVNLPIRYMHTSVETVALDDVAHAARLIATFCLRLDAAAELPR